MKEALHFKQKLKAVDQYPVNAIGAGRPQSSKPGNARREGTFEASRLSRPSTVMRGARFESQDNTIETSF